MYPSKYESEFAIDGEKVKIRPIRPEDEPLWTEMIGSLQPSDQGVPLLRPGAGDHQVHAGALLHVDYDREIAIVAIERARRRRPTMLGVARLTMETGNADEGEFAIVVRDEYQSKGVGTS